MYYHSSRHFLDEIGTGKRVEDVLVKRIRKSCLFYIHNTCLTVTVEGKCDDGQNNSVGKIMLSLVNM